MAVRRHTALDVKSLIQAISPFQEIGVYEHLWSQTGTFAKVSDHLSEYLRLQESISECLTPYELLKQYENESTTLSQIIKAAEKALAKLERANIKPFGIRCLGELEYPKRLLDARHPAYYLYYQGFWNITETPCVSVVGTRKPTEDGRRRTRKLVKELVNDKYTVVSGLAEGIDTVAHETALECGGHTIAVLGTPLNKQYPAANKQLRERLAREQLVISQFPLVANTKPYFFTERNKLMAALSKATIIVEAGETSGTRVQAKAAMTQRRDVFILDSCFRRSDLTWPKKLQEQGAIRVKHYDDIHNCLSAR